MNEVTVTRSPKQVLSLFVLVAAYFSYTVFIDKSAGVSMVLATIGLVVATILLLYSVASRSPVIRVTADSLHDYRIKSGPILWAHIDAADPGGKFSRDTVWLQLSRFSPFGAQRIAISVFGLNTTPKELASLINQRCERDNVQKGS